MEPLGLAVGIAGLAGTFSTCLECFEYIELARSFGEDFGACQLRLDVAKLRMTRWGTAIGLGSESQNSALASMSDRERAVAQNLCEEIIRTFEDAEKISSRYPKRMALQQSQSVDLSVCNPVNDMDPSYYTLHHRMRAFARKRQKETSLLKKTQWALYEKKAFTNMIESVTGFVNDLVELFPAAKEEQVALCQQEVRAIGDNDQNLQIMESVVEHNDAMLQAAVQQALAQRDHSINGFVARGKFRVGDNNEWGREGRAITSQGGVIEESAVVWFGNNNYARSYSTVAGPPLGWRPNQITNNPTLSGGRAATSAYIMDPTPSVDISAISFNNPNSSKNEPESFPNNRSTSSTVPDPVMGLNAVSSGQETPVNKSNVIKKSRFFSRK